MENQILRISMHSKGDEHNGFCFISVAITALLNMLAQYKDISLGKNSKLVEKCNAIVLTACPFTLLYFIICLAIRLNDAFWPMV